jgi:hypothetical protein
MRAFFLSVLLVGVASCSSTTDITKNPTAMTDFVVGQVYALKQACWMRGQVLLTLRGKEPADSEGTLSAGTKLVIRKVLVERSSEVGTYTDVFAEALTGEHRGKTVSVGTISKITKTGYAKCDPEMLERVEGETK